MRSLGSQKLIILILRKYKFLVEYSSRKYF